MSDREINHTEKGEKKKGGAAKIVVLILVVVLALFTIYFAALKRRNSRLQKPTAATVTTTGTITTTSGAGTTATYQVAPQPPFFKATPEVVEAGKTVELSWDIPGAARVEISGIEGTFGTSGRHNITPEDSTKYVLTATMQDGRAPVTLEQLVIVTREGGTPE